MKQIIGACVVLLGGASAIAAQTSEAAADNSGNLVAVTVGWMAVLAILLLIRKRRT